MNPKDIKPGMYLTVTKGPIPWTGHEDLSWQGDVLRVEAVDLPFIVAAILHSGEQPWPMDTRKWTFKELSEPYIRALLGA